MFDDIKVIDKFLSDDELNKVRYKLNAPKWSFTGGGVDDINQSLTSKFWHMNNLDEYFSDDIFNKIKNHFHIKGKLLRTYANGQTATQSGVPHYDDGDVTFLLFTEKWYHQWGGNLFFSTDDEVVKVITYKQNRGVLFPSKILHYAGAPDKTYDGLRVSVAWKIKYE